MKINNYIKYLLTLILLPGINIYAQASENLNQIISQAQQEASGLSPFFNLSSIINTPIIKYLTTTLGSSFLGFAIPFLFVFGVLTFITYENKKEINRPLLLIYFIVDLLITIFFPAILILLAIILAILLLLFGFYKLFHTITGSTIGGIAGAIITAFIFFSILVRFINNSIAGLLALTFLILLSIFFLILIIYALLKIKNEPSTNNIKKLIYHIHKPEDVRFFENQVNVDVNDIENIARSLEQALNYIQNKFKEFESNLQQIRSPKRLKSQIQQQKQQLQQLLPKQLQNDIDNLTRTSIKQMSPQQIGSIIKNLKSLQPQQQSQIGQLINLLQQLGELVKLKEDIKNSLNNYDNKYKKFNKKLNGILNSINDAIKNIQYNYNDPMGQHIINFLMRKGKELQEIKNHIFLRHMAIRKSQKNEDLIKKYIL
jgi:predicted PurR-regulated permease PerM